MKNCELRFISMIWSQDSSGKSAAGARRIEPALLIRMSTVGCSALMRAMSAKTDERSAKSQA
jgi:hypothetical protein